MNLVSCRADRWEEGLVTVHCHSKIVAGIQDPPGVFGGT